MLVKVLILEVTEVDDIQGDEKGRFMPISRLKRSEMSVILQRLAVE